ncbi:hypothetical protein BG454_06645 [Roseinatronobacter bogoriensis subsp. barguzinensis]|uniref:Uncharacterized protein n=1 Tax=Roseinatronobacter bogoriensis subsp. barguzinensis TaxID=441209 RepID=A0A2K8K7W6_9RHOB|nr:hypothetical protein BG454_06645 [Rhodobaca barguzinensis]
MRCGVRLQSEQIHFTAQLLADAISFISAAAMSNDTICQNCLAEFMNVKCLQIAGFPPPFAWFLLGAIRIRGG